VWLVSVSLALVTTIGFGAIGPTGARGAFRSARPLVRFASGDGLTYENRLLIRVDRTAVATYDRRGPGPRRHGTRRFRLTTSTFEHMRRLLQAATFARLRRSYPDPLRGIDVPQYAVTYRAMTVHTEEPAIERGTVPKQLVRTIRLLERIVAAHIPR
jgi:hypothetical protein